MQQTTRLSLVEAARGLAALAVVLFHANASAAQFGGPSVGWMGLLAHGVDFFFVLSGFIIIHAHGGDVGRRDRLWTYLVKRLVRLLPPLWLVVLGWTAYHLVTGQRLDPATLVRSFLPYPSVLETVPTVVWTLRHEFVFYALFAILVASRRAGAIGFVLWGAATAAQFAAVLAGHPMTGVPAFLTSGFTVDFFLGMGVAVIHRRRTFSPSATPLVDGVGAVVATMFLLSSAGTERSSTLDYTSVGATWGTALLGLGFALVLHGLLRLEGRWRVSPALLGLGAASYAIYLIHTPVNAVVQHVAALLPPMAIAFGAGHVLLVICGVGAGYMLHLGFEQPVYRYLLSACSRAIARRRWRSLTIRRANSRQGGDGIEGNERGELLG